MKFFAIVLAATMQLLFGGVGGTRFVCKFPEPKFGTCYPEIERVVIPPLGLGTYVCKGEPLSNICIRDDLPVVKLKVTEEECQDLGGKCWTDGDDVVPISETDDRRRSQETVTPQCDASCQGDPHMMTWSGEAYDYHGECDLVMINAPQLDLRLHIRTTIRYDYSYISSAVLQLGADTLEVSGWGSVILNGVAMPPEQLHTLSKTEGVSFFVNYTNPNPAGDSKHHIFEIYYVPNQAEHIVMKTFKDWVSVKVERGLKSHFADSTGLLGSFLTGEKVARDGASVLEDPVAFGNEWQVLDSEPMLFQSARFPQHPRDCRLPTTTQEQRHRRLGASIARETAETACADWEDHKKRQCIFDVMASGDVEVAETEPF